MDRNEEELIEKTVITGVSTEEANRLLSRRVEFPSLFRSIVEFKYDYKTKTLVIIQARTF